MITNLSVLNFKYIYFFDVSNCSYGEDQWTHYIASEIAFHTTIVRYSSKTNINIQENIRFWTTKSENVYQPSTKRIRTITKIKTRQYKTKKLTFETLPNNRKHCWIGWNASWLQTGTDLSRWHLNRRSARDLYLVCVRSNL